MSAIRACLERGCTNYTTRTRCPEHEAEHERNRRTPSQKITETARWKRLRKRIIAERKPWVCGICSKPIISEADIECDHIVPVAEGGAPYDEANVRLAHRGCNRSRRRRQTTTQKPHPGRNAHRPPWMVE